VVERFLESSVSELLGEEKRELWQVKLNDLPHLFVVDAAFFERFKELRIGRVFFFPYNVAFGVRLR
jgi:hypothetical protein